MLSAVIARVDPREVPPAEGPIRTGVYLSYDPYVKIPQIPGRECVPCIIIIEFQHCELF